MFCLRLKLKAEPDATANAYGVADLGVLNNGYDDRCDFGCHSFSAF